ncbi:NUDIX hydrolase [Flexibacterium corallicola]|uniref:NUDIX hydrolase n=1 Tax=Flexibacterium corallicola TaxID=3037259 RepID=UPI00286F1D84|nr:NUDIX hydrolase [Pseudovibrio sp. M1P-2-3]
MSQILEKKERYKGLGVLLDVTVKTVHPDGREHITREPVWTYGDSISVMPFDISARTVLILKQMRPAPFLAEGIQIFEACAGGIEEDDASPDAACRREAAEELGCTLDELEFIANVYIDPARLTEQAHIYLAPYKAGEFNTQNRDQDEDEDIEVFELSFDELFALYENKEIRCPRLMMLTQSLLLKLKA